MQPDKNFNILDENAEFALKQIGDLLKPLLPEGYGFALFLSTFGKGGAMFYLSDVQRDDMVATLKEFIAEHEKKDA